ncbi:unnamed protein product [Prorocentrum cordatum]|uniref:ZZ-type domain-containing protein n=1 Tax=Prorocentrum cordatum TaxID=2364126 RepID=A0ABN9WEF9_9DINO|nr:unnamed protein product [Polarella glacialis]
MRFLDGGASTSADGYFCDLCGGSSVDGHLGGGLSRWRCEACDYDVCLRCRAGPRGATAALAGPPPAGAAEEFRRKRASAALVQNLPPHLHRESLVRELQRLGFQPDVHWRSPEVAAHFAADWLLERRFGQMPWVSALEGAAEPTPLSECIPGSVSVAEADAAAVQAGCVVTVGEPISYCYTSAPGSNYELREGLRGIVKRIDGSGDALVSWEAMGDKWVLATSFPKLVVEIPPQCDRCECFMRHSELTSGRRSHYECDACLAASWEGHLGGTTHRWRCPQCDRNVCFRCHGGAMRRQAQGYVTYGGPAARPLATARPPEAAPGDGTLAGPRGAAAAPGVEPWAAPLVAVDQGRFGREPRAAQEAEPVGPPTAVAQQEAARQAQQGGAEAGEEPRPPRPAKSPKAVGFRGEEESDVLPAGGGPAEAEGRSGEEPKSRRKGKARRAPAGRGVGEAATPEAPHAAAAGEAPQVEPQAAAAEAVAHVEPREVHEEPRELSPEEAAEMERAAREKAELKAQKKQALRTKKDEERRQKSLAERQARQQAEEDEARRRTAEEAERKAREKSEQQTKKDAKRRAKEAAKAEEERKFQEALQGASLQEQQLSEEQPHRCALCRQDVHKVEPAATLGVCRKHYREVQAIEWRLTDDATYLPKHCCADSAPFSSLHCLAYRYMKPLDENDSLHQLSFVKVLIRLLILNGARPLSENCNGAAPLLSMVSILSLAPHVVLAFLEEVHHASRDRKLTVLADFARMASRVWTAKLPELFHSFRGSVFESLRQVNTLSLSYAPEDSKVVREFLQEYGDYWTVKHGDTCPCCGGEEQTPPRLFIHALSPGQPYHFEGLYKLVGGMLANGEPVWKHEKTDLYLFCSTNGYWLVGGKACKDKRFQIVEDDEQASVTHANFCEGYPHQICGPWMRRYDPVDECPGPMEVDSTIFVTTVPRELTFLESLRHTTLEGVVVVHGCRVTWTVPRHRLQAFRQSPFTFSRMFSLGGYPGMMLLFLPKGSKKKGKMCGLKVFVPVDGEFTFKLTVGAVSKEVTQGFREDDADDLDEDYMLPENAEKNLAGFAEFCELEPQCQGEELVISAELLDAPEPPESSGEEAEDEDGSDGSEAPDRADDQPAKRARASAEEPPAAAQPAEAQPAEAAGRAAAAAVRCPAGHVMKPHDNLDDFVCDVCAADPPRGTILYGCAACEFDICDACQKARASQPCLPIWRRNPVSRITSLPGPR